MSITNNNLEILMEKVDQAPIVDQEKSGFNGVELNNNTASFVDGQFENVKSTLEESSKMNPTGNIPNSASNFGIFSGVSLEMLKPNVWINRKRESLKPVGEFLNFSKFKKPANASQCSARLVKNTIYFQSNYLLVFCILALYCILTSPLLLFTFVLFAGACYLIHIKNKDGMMQFMGREIGVNQLYLAMILASIPIFLMAGVGSAIFWIIGATVVVNALHAIFYARDEPDDPFMAPGLNIV